MLWLFGQPFHSWYIYMYVSPMLMSCVPMQRSQRVCQSFTVSAYRWKSSCCYVIDAHLSFMKTYLLYLLLSLIYIVWLSSHWYNYTCCLLTTHAFQRYQCFTLRSLFSLVSMPRFRTLSQYSKLQEPVMNRTLSHTLFCFDLSKLISEQRGFKTLNRNILTNQLN